MMRTPWRAALVPVLVVCGGEPLTAPSLAAVRCEPPACRSGAALVRAPLEGALQVLDLPTYDGSGQATHPDVAVTPDGWGAGRFHMVVTPYPFGNAQFENPSVYTGSDGLVWATHAEGRNPVAQTAEGHLSDPALVFVPELGELWMYYRQVSDSNRIWLTRSSDGVQWRTPAVTATASNHALISPSVVRRSARVWQMWSVNGGSGCYGPSAFVERRTSRDGITWSLPKRVSIPVPRPGYSVWHIAVAWIPSEGRYWAVFNVKPPGDCATPAVYVATSRDGLTWRTAGTPILERGAIPQFQDIVYRACLTYDPGDDVVHFWFSGARLRGGRYQWSVASQSLDRLDAIPRQNARRSPSMPATPRVAVSVGAAGGDDGPGAHE